uniref:Uncharacterized protein n=1 Tax=Arundo donax TaxID=35708 RepID=A0A0A9BL39_ARUDO
MSSRCDLLMAFLLFIAIISLSHGLVDTPRFILLPGFTLAVSYDRVTARERVDDVIIALFTSSRS